MGLKPDKKLLRHPADADAWKDFDDKYPDFAQDPRNLRVGLATDGFNPFGNMSNSYNMWLVFVILYNLPPMQCTDQSNCLMALLIQGPKSPGKDFDVFMQPLIRDLQIVWKGVLTRDVLAKRDDALFYLRAAVLWCIHDYPALGTMSGRVTGGYNACVCCDKEQLSRKLIRKVVSLATTVFSLRNNHIKQAKSSIICLLVGRMKTMIRRRSSVQRRWRSF